MAIEEEEGEPEEQETAGGADEICGGASLFGQTVDEGVDGALPDAVTARAVNFGEQVGQQGVAADDLQGEGEGGESRAAAVEEQVEEGEQEHAPAAAPQDGGGGVDMLDEWCIGFQQQGREQAGKPDDAHEPDGAKSSAGEDEAAADAAHEGERPEGERGEDPAVGRAVVPCALQESVNMAGQVVIRQEEPARISGIGNKAQQRPVTDETGQTDDDLSAQLAEQEDGGSDEVAFCNGLQCVAEKTHLRWVCACQIPLYQHAQHKEKGYAPQNAQGGAAPPARASFLSIFGEGEGHACSGDEDEERHDQIPAGESSAPLCMPELLHEPIRSPACILQQEIQHACAAAEQEHIQSAQGINAGDSGARHVVWE